MMSWCQGVMAGPCDGRAGFSNWKTKGEMGMDADLPFKAHPHPLGSSIFQKHHGLKEHTFNTRVFGGHCGPKPARQLGLWRNEGRTSGLPELPLLIEAELRFKAQSKRSQTHALPGFWAWLGGSIRSAWSMEEGNFTPTLCLLRV